MISANRLVRTRMPGGVGAGGENPPATRLEYIMIFIKTTISLNDGAVQLSPRAIEGQ